MENKNSKNTQEKMIKKCKDLGSLLNFVFWFDIVIIIISVVAGTIIGAIDMWTSGSSGIVIIDAITMLINIFLKLGIDFSQMNVIKESIITIITYILSLIILHSLAKIFINSSKDETPFSIKNVKNLRTISICLDIIFLVTLFSETHGIGLIYPLTITGIEYIFRYGCKLQLESDETL